MDFNIVEKPGFNLIGKSKVFDYDAFFKEAPNFWKEYVQTEEYRSLWELSSGKYGHVTEAPLMSAYLPNEIGNRERFTDVLGLEKGIDVNSENFEVFPIPAATYAEFNCTYKTTAKTNKYIYDTWFSSTGFRRDGAKPDIAAYFPVAFRPITEMGVRWWIPVTSR